MLARKVNENTINQYGLLDEIVNDYDKAKAKAYFEKKEGIKLIPPKVKQRMYELIKKFTLSGGFDLED